MVLNAELVNSDRTGVYACTDQSYSHKYLLDCRAKLMRKLQSCRELIEVLKNEKSENEIRHRKEIKTIRQFYDVISFARSRTGRMVRSALGTSPAAV